MLEWTLTAMSLREFVYLGGFVPVQAQITGAPKCQSPEMLTCHFARSSRISSHLALKRS
jgi:hypothetical protein